VNSASVSDEFRNAFGRNYREVGLMQLADHSLEKRMQLLIACDPFNLWRIDIAYSIPIDASERRDIDEQRNNSGTEIPAQGLLQAGKSNEDVSR